MFDIRNVLNKLLVLSMLAAFSSNAFSQDANSSTTNELDPNKFYLTLDEAIDYARENDTSYIESKYDYEIAKAVKWQTTSDLWLPTVTAAGSVSFVDQDTANTGLSSYDLEGPQDQWGASLSLSKTLFNGMRYWYNNKISDVSLRSSEEALADSEKNIDLNTKLSFYNLFILQENYRVFEVSDRMLATSLAQTRTKYNNGMVSRYEYLSAQVQYENNKPTLIALSNSYYTAKLQFIKDLGIDKSVDEVELLGNVEDALNLNLPELNEDELMKTIMSSNYDIRSMEYTLETLDYAQKAARYYWFPTVSLSGSLTTSLNNSVSGTTSATGTTTYNLDREWEMGWKVGITLSYQLDSLIPISRPAQQRKEAKLKLEKAEATYRNLKNTVEVQCRSLINNIRSQEASIDTQKKNAETALYAYQMAANQYRGGTLSSVQLNDAQLAYQQAQLNYLQAIYDYYSSALQLLKLLDM